MISTTELLSCLGKRSDEPKLISLLHAFDILRSPQFPDEYLSGLDPDITEPQDWLTNRSDGIEFGFEDEAAFIGEPVSEWGRSPMILTQIYLFANDTQHSNYSGSWPFDISPSGNRADIRMLMVDYGLKLRTRKRDTWVSKEFMMTVDYGEDGKKIRYLVLMAQPPRLSISDTTIRADQFPPIVNLCDCLGCDETDSVLENLLRPIGFSSHRIKIEPRGGIIDLRESFGFIANLVSGESELLMFERFQLLGDQRYGSAIWLGELPNDLDFSMDWSETLDSMGRAPDGVVEDDFRLNAYWHSGAVTTEVEYSTMENQILSVSIRKTL